MDNNKDLEIVNLITFTKTDRILKIRDKNYDASIRHNMVWISF